MIGFQYICNLFNVQYKDVADQLGISKQTINSWVSGRRKIPEKYLPMLSKKFNIPEKYFTKEIETIDELVIQESKIEKELDLSDVFDKKISEISKEERDKLRKLSKISVDIDCIEITERIKKLFKFENVPNRIDVTQILVYLESTLDILESYNNNKISIACNLVSILLHYYEPGKYPIYSDTSQETNNEYSELYNEFNNAILKAIKNYSEKEKEIENKIILKESEIFLQEEEKQSHK